MKNKNWIGAVLMLTFSLYAFSNVKASGKDTHKAEVEQMTKMILSILKDRNYSTYKDFISPGAYIINNNDYESFFKLMTDNSDRKSFIEGKDIIVGFVSAMIPDDHSAYIVLKTQSTDGTDAHWHSVYFVLGKNNKWQIYSWHKS